MVVKIDSNLTGLAYAVEASIGVLPGSPVWVQVEPNSYADFGGMTKLTKRAVITPSRMTRKGVVTDLDVAAGFQVDLTQRSMHDLFPGFLYSAWEDRSSVVPTGSSVTSTDHYIAVSTGFLAGTLIFVSGFAGNNNNGFKKVTAVGSGTITCAAQSLSVEASPGADAFIKQVGFKFAAGDLTASLVASVPTLACTVASFLTSFPGIEAGDWLYIGGDDSGSTFVGTPAINGWCRVATAAAQVLTMDKVSGTWATDAGAAKTIQVFMGDRLHNQHDVADQVRTTYQWERSLSVGGFEYITGATPNEVTITMGMANKITVDLKFIGMDNELVTFGTGAKTGDRTTQVQADALNTTSDFSRLTLLNVDASPIPGSSLTTYLMDAAVTVNNNATATKALTVLGAIDINLGDIEVDGKLTAYFTDTAIMSAAKENPDVSLDFALVRNNTGMLIDIPLVSVSDARLSVVKDKPIEVPITMNSAMHPDLLYVMMIQSFDYLPTVAE